MLLRWSLFCSWLVILLPQISSLALAGEDEVQKRVFKRRHDFSDEDLRKNLQTVPELGFGQAAATFLYEPLKKAAKTPTAIPFDYGPAACAQLSAKFKRPDLNSLPWSGGVDSQLGKEAAERLHVLSNTLRRYLRESTSRDDIRPDADKLRELIQNGKRADGRRKGSGEAEANSNEWSSPEAIPTLLQLLQAENTPIRLLLVELLAGIEGKQASVALAQRALFDLSAKVREQAVESLRKRPHAEFRQVFVEGLRYPWAPAADHSAEALASLQMQDVVPDLVALLKEPDPKSPFPVEFKDKKLFGVRELVRINHLSNCVLCHAPSTSKEDLVRGRIPIPGEEPPPLYYQERTGIFIRADITFLRQDFSVPQPVLNPIRWPGIQRFDYFIRTRKATPAEVKVIPTEPKTDFFQREAMLFALREITGRNPGREYGDWLPLLKSIEKQKR